MQIEIKDLLKKFTDLLNNEDLKKAFIQKAVQKVLNIEIPLEGIVIKKDTAYLKLSPLQKSEVFMKQEKIISEINLSLKHIKKLG